MPESDVKYFPVLARILLLLDGKPITLFRTSIVSRRKSLEPDFDLVHRFVTEYKGKSRDCAEGHPVEAMYRTEMIEHLTTKCKKEAHFMGKKYEPMVEITIDLRGAKVTARSI